VSEPSPSFPLPALPPPLRVIDDLPCRTCGYNLRTLATTGICPECATPVAASISGDLLRFADPNWLARVKLGCGLFRMGVVLRFLAWAAHAAWAQLLLAPAGSALMLAGAWLFTIPDPSGLGEKKCGPLRAWARSLATIYFPISLTTAFAIPFLSYLIWYRELQLVVAAACASTLIVYLRAMAARLGRAYVSESLRSLLLLYLGTSVWLAIFRVSGNVGARFFGPFWMLLTGINSFAQGFYFLFLFQPISTFYAAIKEEAAAAPQPAGNSLWRSAGSFLYSARQLFRSKNGNDN
jgi:hypothetical protein